MLFQSEEQKARQGLDKLIWKIFKALRWYNKKNPQFTEEDAAYLLKNYGQILEEQKGSSNENLSKPGR